MVPLAGVKSAHVRGLLDGALVTNAEERIGLDKVWVVYMCAAWLIVV